MPHDSSPLTIAIPTYGRPQELRHCVQLLAAQSDASFRLLILDNASPVPAAVALEGLLDSFPSESVRLVRNRVNIGGDANILRCFEMCETEYLWILGDDDEPLPNAVETVHKTLRNHPGALFYNFACELYPRQKEIVTRNLDEFIASIDSFSNLLFTSTSIFQRNALVDFLSSAHEFTYSMATQIAIVLLALMVKPGHCLLLRDRIVHWELPPGGTRWSLANQLLGQGILLDLPLDRVNRKRLARVLPRPRALECLTIQLLVEMLQSKDRSRPRYILDQAYSRLLCHSSSILYRGRYILYRYGFFLFPSFGLALFRLVIKLTGRGKDLLIVQSPFNQIQESDI
jgi:glycosyltransferase involved in cell wall biosynthesis